MEQRVRRIFFMWSQGLERAPRVVGACYESWVRQNPGWEVILLDEANLASYVVMPAWTRKLSPTQLSDFVRLQVLSKYGGVWADATTYCNWPLDAWLPVESGFFAFAWPARGYLFSTWFLYSEPGNCLVGDALGILSDYWRLARLDRHGLVRDLFAKVLVRVLRTHPTLTTLWLTYPVRDLLRVYPYFAIHYSFARAILRSVSAASVWRATPKVMADGPHQLQRYGLASPADTLMRLELAAPSSPVYKLTWKDAAASVDDARSTLGILLAESQLSKDGAPTEREGEWKKAEGDV
ncbi:MAG: capsular polysaccharide synthesis protein [Micropruina sp.]|uniref:capsular polysaccharide synthesis protein n=1 Tax=Micropruina sp. TaxID=2737536 RepID=UPI0039E2B05B